jgi:UDP-glucuronate decarboxylase
VNPGGVRSCYDEGKRCAETLLCDYHRQHGVDIRIARIFNTYGPRMHPNDGRVVSNFVTQALTDRPIEIFGDGTQTRSFCYVDDLIEGILALMESGLTRPVNLGNPREIIIAELATLIIELTGSRSRIVHKPIPQDDPRRRKPDTALAQSHLGWAAKTPLTQGLQRTIDYFDALLRVEGKLAPRVSAHTGS